MSEVLPAGVDPGEVARRFALARLASEEPRAVHDAVPEPIGTADPCGAVRTVRVKLYRKVTRIRVALDAASGELAFLADDLGPAGPADGGEEPIARSCEITSEQALARARLRVEVPANATPPMVSRVGFYGGDCYQCSWRHVVDGVRVLGDGIDVWIQAATGRFVALARKWRRVPPELSAQERRAGMLTATAPATTVDSLRARRADPR